MMRISTLLLGAALSLSPFPAMMAQTYCQLTKNSGGNNWAHANSQSFYSLKVSSDVNEVYRSTDEKKIVNGIDNVSTDKAAAEVYTLEGVKPNKQVNELPKGIYIVNGKKVVVK